VAAPLLKGRLAGNEVEVTGLLILAASLLLPVLFPAKIGWLASLIPLPVFYYYTRLGGERGSALIRNSIVFSTVGALIFGVLPNLVFSLTMIPLGIVLSHGVIRKKSLVGTGFTGFMILAITWLLYWAGLVLLFQTNPYGTLLTEIDRGLSNGLMVYEKSAELAPETLAALKQAINLLREYFPKILPALLISALLSITWLNLALGTWLLQKRDSDQTPWPKYTKWKLPDSLVWLVICSGIFTLLLPKPLSTIGLNGLIICSTLYFFQGLAIAANFLKKWSVPGLLRVLIYALIFIQTYGIIILSFLGLIDVWADFRKLDHAGDNTNGSL